ncbi:hypothetical protein D3C84_944260 [compost metagenome]
MIHQLVNHHVDRGQRFDQIHHQGFARGFGINRKQGADRARRRFDIGRRREVKVERAFGGFVELF